MNDAPAWRQPWPTYARRKATGGKFSTQRRSAVRDLAARAFLALARHFRTHMPSRRRSAYAFVKLARTWTSSSDLYRSNDNGWNNSSNGKPLLRLPTSQRVTRQWIESSTAQTPFTGYLG